MGPAITLGLRLRPVLMAAEGYRVTCWVTIGEVIVWTFLGVLYSIHLLVDECL